MAPLETTQETDMFDDNDLEVMAELSAENDGYINFDDDAEASEENDSKLEFANELLQDYSFDNQ